MIRALSQHVRTNHSCQVQILADGIGESQRQQTRLVVNKADTAAPIRPCNCHMMGDLDAEHPEAGPIPVSCIASCGNWQHTKLLKPQGSRRESRKAWRQFPPVALLSSTPQLLSRFFKFDPLTVVFWFRLGYYFYEVIELTQGQELQEAWNQIHFLVEFTSIALAVIGLIVAAVALINFYQVH
ncbi:hypothetical protein [Schleiferilactobacillus harbinensis]|uniref:Uncharacterized protein n=1 Tax=Schleiferilactobacillus harbinensis TaxID=304207 RepID=A0A5P8M6H4_9LACO|nr:hypothetical protein [Schleiferilactobacillus harbinensis]QFR24100.1 hypothetical protein D1010_12290 [Schleiferilactobacillus harbinensis]